MPKYKPPPTVTPQNHLIFDPWHTAASGHQRAETTPGTAWQRSREMVLAHQLRTGDSTIWSSLDKDMQRAYEEVELGWVSRRDAKGQDPKQRDIRRMMRVQKADSTSTLNGKKEAGMSVGTGIGVVTAKGEGAIPTSTSPDLAPGPISGPTPTPAPTCAPTPEEATPGAFSGDNNMLPASYEHISEQPRIKTDMATESTILWGTTVYVNGRTAPLVSDHKLKRLLVAHGATLALSMSRRVTHVIIGKPNSGPGRGGAGGGLAAGKIQKEIQRGGCRGVRVVGVDWVLESVNSGKRLPETRFAVNLSNQRSVLGFM
ncbi:hypothetical protein BJX76DRAFT_356360 [Aspergillus varians]